MTPSPRSAPAHIGISSLTATAGSDGLEPEHGGRVPLSTHSCHASELSPPPKQPGLSCATSLPPSDRFATASQGTGSGRGGIAGGGEAVDRRTRPHIGGHVASPSRRPPSPRRPMPPHAQDQYSPVRLAGWRASRTSWPTCASPGARTETSPLEGSCRRSRCCIPALESGAVSGRSPPGGAALCLR